MFKRLDHVIISGGAREHVGGGGGEKKASRYKKFKTMTGNVL